jgi:peptide deformylase
MAVLPILTQEAPILRQKAKRVGRVDDSIRKLIDDMVETMREYDGAGLAANQVHTLRQICVIEVLGNPRYPDVPHIPLTVLINPVVTPLTDEMESGWEGCLSVPDMRGLVPRYTSVRLEAYDRDGGRIDVVAKEFFARVVQHETDHLKGIVYIDRMRDLSSLSYIAEWQRYALGIREQQD